MMRMRVRVKMKNEDDDPLPAGNLLSGDQGGIKPGPARGGRGINIKNTKMS